MPPKRDFIRENVRSLKQLDQRKRDERSLNEFNVNYMKTKSVHGQYANHPQKAVKTKRIQSKENGMTICTVEGFKFIIGKRCS